MLTALTMASFTTDIPIDWFLRLYIIFFFSSRRRHTRCSRDWSSDVCSSDLIAAPGDDEWMLGLQGENVGGELQSHLRRFNHHTITSETMTILATATQKPSGSWTSGMRLKFIP